jgi:hypothetical protein
MTKIYLKVPFADNQLAKSLGGRWDPNEKNGIYIIIVNWLK